MKSFVQLIRKSRAGQTSVEYILMIAVLAAVAVPLFKQLEAYIVSNPNSILNTTLESYKSMFGGDNGGLTLAYKRFSIRR